MCIVHGSTPIMSSKFLEINGLTYKLFLYTGRQMNIIIDACEVSLCTCNANYKPQPKACTTEKLLLPKSLYFLFSDDFG